MHKPPRYYPVVDKPTSPTSIPTSPSSPSSSSVASQQPAASPKRVTLVPNASSTSTRPNRNSLNQSDDTNNASSFMHSTSPNSSMLRGRPRTRTLERRMRVSYGILPDADDHKAHCFAINKILVADGLPSSLTRQVAQAQANTASDDSSSSLSSRHNEQRDAHNTAMCNSVLDPTQHQTLFTASRDSSIRLWQVDHSTDSQSNDNGGSTARQPRITSLGKFQDHADWVNDLALFGDNCRMCFSQQQNQSVGW
jgi:hypothetical protein